MAADRNLARQIAARLEELRAIDEPSLRRILHTRVPVDQAVALDDRFAVICFAPGEEHPGRAGEDGYSITLHGVLNAIIGLDDETGWGVLSATVNNETGEIAAVHVVDPPPAAAPDTSEEE